VTAEKFAPQDHQGKQQTVPGASPNPMKATLPEHVVQTSPGHAPRVQDAPVVGRTEPFVRRHVEDEQPSWAEQPEKLGERLLRRNGLVA
jgi:hypothetical protein